MIASVPGVARVQCCRRRAKVGPTTTSSKLEPSCAVTAACTRLADADSDQSEDGHNVRDHLKAPRQSRQPYASECARSGLMARCAHDGGRATSQYRTSPLALPVSRDADVRLRVAAEGLLVPWRNLRIQPTPLSVRNADLQQEPRSGGIRPQRKFPINQYPAAPGAGQEANLMPKPPQLRPREPGRRPSPPVRSTSKGFEDFSAAG